MKDKYQHTIYACYIGYITQAIVNNLAPLLFLIFRRDFHIGLGEITLLTTVNFLVQLLVDLASVGFVDKIGYRASVLLAHIAAASGLVGMAVLPHILPSPYVGLMISVICYAIGGGLTEVVISPIVEACPTEKKEAAMSLLHSFYCWGQVLVVLFSTLFFQVFGTKQWYILAMLWALVPFLNIFYFLKVPIYPIVAENEGLSLRELFRQKLFWILLLLMVCAGACELGMSQWASAFAESALHVSKTIGDLAGPCAFAVLMGSARALYGKYSDYLPLKSAMAFCSILCVICYLLAALADSPVFALLGCAVCGFSVGIFWPGTFSMAAKHLPRGGTAMFALMALAGDLGCSSGPTVIGFVAGAGHGLKGGLLVAIVFPLLMLTGLLLLGRQKQRSSLGCANVIRLPEAVKEIIDRLEEAGYEAYAVGGCVRDTLLGRVPEDWDITTSAKPMEIKALFRRTIDTGIQHGTVTVMLNHVGYEVTTYRIDGEYEDNRHPKEVAFTGNLVEDLQRRDFTINAMAYNTKSGLVDAFDGIGDLERGVIRCVGDPDKRFDEDALRMLRAVRFSGQLGFAIEEKTREAIVARAQFLKNISAERIRVELVKLLVSKEAQQLREAVETGMTAYFLPELDAMLPLDQRNPHHIYTVGEHSIYSIQVMNLFFGLGEVSWSGAPFPEEVIRTAREITADCDKKTHQALCMTMLLHDVAKPSCMTVDEDGVGHFRGHPQAGEAMAGRILRRLTFDNDTVSLVKGLIAHHDEQISPEPRSLRRATSRIGRERMPLLCLVQLADVLAQNPALAEEKLARILAVYHQFRQMEEERPALTVKELAITGRDIMEELSIGSGPHIGELLHSLLEEVLENPEQNTRKTLLLLAKAKYSGKL